MGTWAGACEMHSQNVCPVPPQSYSISAEHSKEPSVPIVQVGQPRLHDMPARVGSEDQDPPCQDWLLPSAHDTKKRTLCLECADQARPNLGDAGQEGRVMGSECHPLPSDKAPSAQSTLGCPTERQNAKVALKTPTLNN